MNHDLNRHPIETSRINSSCITQLYSTLLAVARAKLTKMRCALDLSVWRLWTMTLLSLLRLCDQPVHHE